MEPMERAKIEAELREILREYVRRPERPIEPGDHLIFDLEIDEDDASFDMIPEIERRFGIDPPGFAWSSAATFADVVALVERYQRQPATAEERALDEAREREAAREGRKVGARMLAVLGTGVGLQFAGGLGVPFFGVALAGYMTFRLRDLARHRHEREEWKVRRATRT
jgi:acyl carrier protein